MLKEVFNSFFWAKNGLMTVWREERNFKIEILVMFCVLLFAFYFDFTVFELVSCIIAILFVICGEIINTAIEDICNKIEPNQDPAMGKIKDIMAGFVLVSSIGALVIGALVFYNHFYA